jgi:CheY-like chemotaxis protein
MAMASSAVPDERSGRKKILLVGRDSSLQHTRRLILERPGYEVVHLTNPETALNKFTSGEFNLVLLGSLISEADKELLAREIKSISRLTPVVNFAEGVAQANEDARLEALSGPDRLLSTVGRLVMKNHGHPEIGSKYYAYVDHERRYVCVSDALCRALGCDQEDLIGKRIEAITHPSEPGAPKTMFQTYLRDGRMHGEYVLKHRSGTPVRISFRATTLPDGCLVSEMELLGD